MWRRIYLLSVLVRLYFALSPSYIHPDEHFQGPEIIAGEVFGYPIYKTWEFTSSHPIRSIFPFWLIYGWPLTVLKWIYEGLGYGPVPPTVAFHTLRTIMFLLSFVLGDWAIHELVPAINHRRVAIMLVATSYVTWTYQTHTFSNSIETLVVLWSLVLINKLRDNTQETLIAASAGLAFLGVLGVVNRITFPAFLVVSLPQVLPSLYRRPLRLLVMLVVAALTFTVAITMDTEFYMGIRPRIRELFSTAVLTTWNNLAYNVNTTNLARHGLHPFWQHIAANLPQLIGPAFPLVFISSRKNTLFWSAVVGAMVLSCFPHQEPRFLLPAVPLLLSTIQLPRRGATIWLGVWLLFNTLAGILFGVYHQGGVVPAQTWIAQQDDIVKVFWWKTYSPPEWLLNGRNEDVETKDLMGIPGANMIQLLDDENPCSGRSNNTEASLLVAPSSATFLDQYTTLHGGKDGLSLERAWHHKQHIGLDDLDFGDDGVWPTLQRVVGRRGLTAWSVRRQCR